ncbi:CCAAT/enhancer-binding protein beta [Orchesella cincta]|uniref:CCAAT/enhancer-binding protein beta n=1 Tax=Orchesella cincta TaxID=48709 RepID=A0A1D2NJ29_ORCCI|nr:CCAAT/enhancer-binding protein beta [Orchesella cincta]
MATSPQMYDNGLENLKRAALSAKVRSFLSGGGEIDPSDLENAELSLDLQSLIEDPNFEVGEGLFPELIHDKLNGGGKGPAEYSQLAAVRSHPNQNGHPFPRNPLAYMPQPVHQGSSFNGPANANNGSGGNAGGASNNSSPQNGVNVKEEPHDHHRLDFNANAVTSSNDPNGYGPYSSNSLSSVTSPSSTSSSSSTGGGGSQGYSPNAYSIHHHLTPATIPSGAGGESNGLIVKNGSLTFNGKPMHAHGGANGHHPHSNGHHHNHHPHHHHGSGSSKKLKNVDKASDEYKRRRERNNIAVRKSREKAKMRTRETEERVKILSKENERLQKKIDLLTEELTFLRSFFSNVGGLPEQIHREFNKHLETFQHHHVQNGIQ